MRLYDEMQSESNGIDFMQSVLSVCGFARLKSLSWRKRSAYFSYGFLNFSIVLTTFTLGLIKMVKQLKQKEYDRAFKKLGTLSIIADAIFMVLFSVTQWSQIHEFDSKLKETADTFAHSSEAFTKIHKRHAKTSKRVVQSFVMMSAGLGIIWTIVIVILFITYPDDSNELWEVISMADDVNLNEAIDSWFICLVQLCRVSIVALMLPIKIASPSVLVILIEGQLLILEESLFLIQRLGLNTTGSTDMHQLSADIREYDLQHRPTDDRLTDDVNVQLKNCIIHHQKILRSVQKMKQFVGPVLFSGLICGLTFTGNCASVITRISGNAAMLQTPPLLLYLSAQIFYVWSLASLKIMCSRVGSAAYGIQLFTSGIRCRRLKTCLLLMIQRAQVKEKFPCVLTSNLTMPILYKLLQSCWSYIMMARTQANQTFLEASS